MNQPQLLGVLNVTPNSFSDGGKYQELPAIKAQALRMIEAGVDVIDIGGESTGPGSPDVQLKEELQRVIPAIQCIRSFSDVPISIDTYKAEVAQQALESGATMVNDVTALRGDSKMASVIAQHQVPAILMYSKDPTARTTTSEVHYPDIIETIISFFEERICYAEQQGIAQEQLILDPGMGMFISSEASYSFEIIKRFSELQKLRLPLLVGTSRKSFLASVSAQKPLAVDERETPTAITSAIALWQGAQWIRVHDVAQGRLTMDTIQKIVQSSNH